ncbi:MAG TPA: antibiotic biosynthesis monooxygenase [Bacteroidales bacterium]|nr:antibiotic biosynthesis monooxygenase [Bacteroidales bacterium]
MIGRIWIGKVLEINRNEFIEYIKQTGLPGLKETEGNLGVQILVKDIETLSQIMIISFWDSEESIRNFTGTDITKARLYPEDQKYLISMDPVVHYEVVIKDC